MSYGYQIVEITQDEPGTNMFPGGVVDFSLLLDFSKTINFS